MKKTRKAPGSKTDNELLKKYGTEAEAWVNMKRVERKFIKFLKQR